MIEEWYQTNRASSSEMKIDDSRKISTYARSLNEEYKQKVYFQFRNGVTEPKL